MIHDLANHQNIASAVANKLTLIIRNTADNDRFIPESVKQSDLIKNDEWLFLKFNNSDYYFDYIDTRQQWYVVLSSCQQESKLCNICKRTELKIQNYCNISFIYTDQVDRLGRYTIQPNEGYNTILCSP